MRSIAIFSLCFFLILGCSNTDNEYDNLTTSFQGIVLNINTNDPISGGQIRLLGSENLDFVYEKYFPIESDGTFNIRITTDNISLFQVGIEGYYVSCSGPSISQYCTLMAAGEDHNDITIMAGVDHIQ